MQLNILSDGILADPFVKNLLEFGRAIINEDDNIINVLDCVVNKPHASTRINALDLVISKATVHRSMIVHRARLGTVTG